jgi:transcription initiation factor IIE alpha subunit
MAGGTQKIEYFSCPKCRARYSAERAEEPTVQRGQFVCIDCRDVVHKWDSVWRYYGWKKLETTRSVSFGHKKP